MPKQYLDPKSDIVFKKLFGTKEHKSSLLSFLNAVLALPPEKRILEATVRNPNLIAEVFDDIASSVDILVTDAQGNKYDIEMQKGYAANFIQRMHYYVAGIYRQGVARKADYEKLHPVVLIAISGYTIFKNKADCISYHKMLDVKTQENDLPYFNFIFVELPKFTKTLSEIQNDLDRWLYFLKHAEESIPEDEKTLTSQNQVFVDAYQALDMHNWTELEQATYERMHNSLHDAAEEGELRGLVKGKAEGKAEGMREVAKNLKGQGISKQIIAQTTGLSFEEIDEL